MEFKAKFEGKVKTVTPASFCTTEWKSGSVVFESDSESQQWHAKLYLSANPSRVAEQKKITKSNISIKSDRLIIDGLNSQKNAIHLKLHNKQAEARQLVDKIVKEISKSPKHNKAEVGRSLNGFTPTYPNNSQIESYSPSVKGMESLITPSPGQKNYSSSLSTSPVMARKRPPESPSPQTQSSSTKRRLELQSSSGVIKQVQFTGNGIEAKSFYGSPSQGSYYIERGEQQSPNPNKRKSSPIREKLHSNLKTFKTDSGSLHEAAVLMETPPVSDGDINDNRHNKKSSSLPDHSSYQDTDNRIISRNSNDGTGLANLGNTCFMNSPLYCLSHLEPFSLDVQQAMVLEGRHFKRDSVTRMLYQIMKNLRKNKRTNTRDILAALQNAVSGKFKHDTQQDAHELMTDLLDRINSEVETVKKGQAEVEPLKNGQEDNHREDSASTSTGASGAAVGGATAMNTRLNSTGLNCPIDTNFKWFYSQTFQCKVCGTCTTGVEQSDTILILPVDPTKENNIQDCVDGYFSSSEMDKNCVKCGKSETTVCTRTIVQRPRILMMMLMRYKLDESNRYKKMSDVINIPRHISIDEYCGETAKPPPYITPAFLLDNECDVHLPSPDREVIVLPKPLKTNGTCNPIERMKQEEGFEMEEGMGNHSDIKRVLERQRADKEVVHDVNEHRPHRSKMRTPDMQEEEGATEGGAEEEHDGSLLQVRISEILNYRLGQSKQLVKQSYSFPCEYPELWNGINFGAKVCLRHFSDRCAEGMIQIQPPEIIISEGMVVEQLETIMYGTRVCFNHDLASDMIKPMFEALINYTIDYIDDETLNDSISEMFKVFENEDPEQIVIELALMISITQLRESYNELFSFRDSDQRNGRSNYSHPRSSPTEGLSSEANHELSSCGIDEDDSELQKALANSMIDQNGQNHGDDGADQAPPAYNEASEYNRNNYSDDLGYLRSTPPPSLDYLNSTSRNDNSNNPILNPLDPLSLGYNLDDYTSHELSQVQPDFLQPEAQLPYMMRLSLLEHIPSTSSQPESQSRLESTTDSVNEPFFIDDSDDMQLCDVAEIVAEQEAKSAGEKCSATSIETGAKSTAVEVAEKPCFSDISEESLSRDNEWGGEEERDSGDSKKSSLDISVKKVRFEQPNEQKSLSAPVTKEVTTDSASDEVDSITANNHQTCNHNFLYGQCIICKETKLHVDLCNTAQDTNNPHVNSDKMSSPSDHQDLSYAGKNEKCPNANQEECTATVKRKHLQTPNSSPTLAKKFSPSGNEHDMQSINDAKSTLSSVDNPLSQDQWRSPEKDLKNELTQNGDKSSSLGINTSHCSLQNGACDKISPLGLTNTKDSDFETLDDFKKPLQSPSKDPIHTSQEPLSSDVVQNLNSPLKKEMFSPLKKASSFVKSKDYSRLRSPSKSPKKRPNKCPNTPQSARKLVPEFDKLSQSTATTTSLLDKSEEPTSNGEGVSGNSVEVNFDDKSILLRENIMFSPRPISINIPSPVSNFSSPRIQSFQTSPRLAHTVLPSTVSEILTSTPLPGSSAKANVADAVKFPNILSAETSQRNTPLDKDTLLNPFANIKPKAIRSLAGSFSSEEKENKIKAESPEAMEIKEFNKRLEYIESGKAPASYKLMGIINHQGDSPVVGHYISYCYKFPDRQWFYMNDSKIESTTENVSRAESTKTGYVFFYMDKDLFDKFEEKAPARSSSNNKFEEKGPSRSSLNKASNNS